MPENMEEQFARRIERFFKSRYIKMDGLESKKLIEHFYIEFKNQGRFNEDGSFYITSQFIFRSLTNFLNIRPNETIGLFRQYRKTRFSTHNRPVQGESSPDVIVPRTLIQILGRKHKPRYKLTQSDGSALSPKKVAKTKEHTATFDVSFSPAVPLHSDKPRERAVSSSGKTFEKTMESRRMALWIEKTPPRKPKAPTETSISLLTPLLHPEPPIAFSEAPPAPSGTPAASSTSSTSLFFSPYRLRVAKPKPEDLRKISHVYDAIAKKGTTEYFEFTVTRKEVIARINAKRPVSQKKVNGNISAFEVMKALGIIIQEKQNGRCFHWAHRRGWSLHGEQEKGNFDPMSAGANYDTLFKVEAPLKKLLINKKLSEVTIHGQVKYDEEIGLPFQISYQLSWGTNEFVNVVIDPTSARIPTEDEHEMAEIFFGMATTSSP